MILGKGKGGKKNPTNSLPKMTSHTKWRPLPTFPDLPALLVSPGFNVGSSSYSLQVTDLAHVWTESLDRKGILRRSLNEDTSIDLSDGDKEQWRVFLSKLEAAFDPATPDHGLTSLTLSPHGDGSSSGPENLLLYITCVLPEPLAPLKWPVYLTRRQPDVFASELVVPLIQAGQVRTQETEYLVARLKEKDAVINRLVDKLQAVGTGLEHVFHSLPIKRKATRVMAEEKVQGLKPFHELEWRLQCATSLRTHQDIASLILDAFGGGDLDGVRENIKVSDQVNEWWKKFEPTSVIIKPKEQSIPGEVLPSTPEKRKPSVESDDDFQVPATPPSAKKNRERRQAATQSGDTTESDEDDEVLPTKILDSYPKFEAKPRPALETLGGRQAQSQSQSSYTVPNGDETGSESEDKPAKPSSVKKPSSRIIKTIGGTETSSPPPSPAKSSSPAPPPSPKDNDETTSESDSGPKTHSSPAPAPVSRRGGLGQIGGRSRITPTLADETRATSAETSASRRTRQGLGTMGKNTGGGGRSRDDSSAEAAIVAEEESLEEKAERKRVELAKELERKAAAPVKKKRRF